MTRRARTLVVSALSLLLCLGVVAGASGAANAPVEPYAGYQPQTTCSAWDKPGTKTLARWVVATYGGRYGSISRSCAGRSVSEHKEGRAFDWTLNAALAADRARANRLMRDLFATGAEGEPAELARRMGVMYVIWNDHMYASYDQFRAKSYRSASCRRLSTCSKTLRHRDHLHISLTRDGGAARTSWYVARADAR